MTKYYLEVVNMSKTKQIKLNGFEAYKSLSQVVDIKKGDEVFEQCLIDLIEEANSKVIAKARKECEKELKKLAKQQERELKKAEKEKERELKKKERETKKALRKELREKAKADREKKRAEAKAKKEKAKIEREAEKEKVRMKKLADEKMFEDLTLQAEIYVEDNEPILIADNFHRKSSSYYDEHILDNDYVKLSENRKYEYLRDLELSEPVTKEFRQKYKRLGILKKFLVLRELENNGKDNILDFFVELSGVKGKALNEMFVEEVRNM